jgi:hypothetical protein
MSIKQQIKAGFKVEARKARPEGMNKLVPLEKKLKYKDDSFELDHVSISRSSIHISLTMIVYSGVGLEHIKRAEAKLVALLQKFPAIASVKPGNWQLAHDGNNCQVYWDMPVKVK